MEDLLQRVEEHLLINHRGNRKQSGSQNDTLARADRARRTAAVGGYRKATTGLVSSMLSLVSVRICRGPRSFFPPPPCARRPTAIRTCTRLCWQRKKNGKTRPIKMGEFLCSANARRLVNQHHVVLRSKALRMHQWGISLPGACAGLCHWRGTIEPLVATLSTCLATPSGPISAPPCAPTSLRLLPGPSGSTSLALSPLSLLEPRSPPTGERNSRAMCWAPSRARWSWVTRETPTPGELFSNSLDAKVVCDEVFVDDGQLFVRPWSL